MTSKSTLGRPFCLSTRMPALTAVWQAWTFGTPSTLTMQLAHEPLRQYRPRGRWYLNDRAVTVTPAAAIADAMVSPSKHWTVRPSSENDSDLDRFNTSPGAAASLEVTRLSACPQANRFR